MSAAKGKKTHNHILSKPICLTQISSSTVEPIDVGLFKLFERADRHNAPAVMHLYR